MAEFSIQDAAFTGFRVVREHPRAVIVWAVLQLAVSIVLIGCVVGLAGADFGLLLQFSLVNPPDAAKMLTLFRRLAPVVLLVFVISLAFNALFNAALYRAVLRPDQSRYGFVRLGADELRQFGLQILQWLVFMAAYIALVILASLVVAAISLVEKSAILSLVAVALTGVAAVLIYLSVRLSLAGPQTFDTGRISLFGSWSLTRRRFWPLFGTYSLLAALAAVIYLLSLLVIMAVVAVLSGGHPAASVVQAKPLGLSTYLSLATIVQTILQAGLLALLLPVVVTPPAAIYRNLVAGSVVPQPAVQR